MHIYKLLFVAQKSKVNEVLLLNILIKVIRGAINSTSISGNFGLKLNGSVRFNWKVSKASVHLSKWTTFLG